MQTLLPLVCTCRVTHTQGVSGTLNRTPPSESSYCKFLLDLVAVEFVTVPPHYTDTLRIHHLFLHLSLPLSLFILSLHLQFSNLPSVSLQPLFLFIYLFIYLFLLLLPPLRHIPSTSHVFNFYGTEIGALITRMFNLFVRV